MKVSYIQIFDNSAEAQQAFGYVQTVFPNHSNTITTDNSQVQILWTENGKSDRRTIGDLDDKIVYLVLSIAR